MHGLREFIEDLFECEVVALLKRSETGFEKIIAPVDFSLDIEIAEWFDAEDRDRILKLDNFYIKSAEYLLVARGLKASKQLEVVKYLQFVLGNFEKDLKLAAYKERLKFVVALANKLVRVFTQEMLFEEVGKLFVQYFDDVTVVIYTDNGELYAFSNSSRAGLMLFLKRVEDEFKTVAESRGVEFKVDFSSARLKLFTGNELLPDYTTGFVFPIVTRSKRVILVGIYGLKHDYGFFFRLIANYLFIAVERIFLFEKVFEASVKDGLTGLYNRAFFNQIIEREVERARRYQLPISVVMIDVDHFKKINDTYGHQVGDEVLKKVSKVIVENTRASDIVARYGGEEIVVVMPQTADGSVMWAERVRERIKLECKNPPVTASFGVCIADYSYGDWRSEELIKAADEALYSAKRNGRDRVEVVDLRLKLRGEKRGGSNEV